MATKTLTGLAGALRRAVPIAAALAAVSFAVQAQPDGMEPLAQRMLKRSTDFLASQQRFSLETRTSLEVVLVSGQKLQYDQNVKQVVQRPNKMRADRTGDPIAQTFYYDGKTVTLFNPGDKYYASASVPGTLEDALDFAREKLDLVAPAGDLFHRNAYEILMTDVTSGFVVGKGVVEGVRCDHLAFRAPHVDWQIWIREGAQPLPMKFVLTTRDVVNAPQFSVTADLQLHAASRREECRIPGALNRGSLQ
jgi:hypothetical protein